MSYFDVFGSHLFNRINTCTTVDISENNYDTKMSFWPFGSRILYHLRVQLVYNYVQSWFNSDNAYRTGPGTYLV